MRSIVVVNPRSGGGATGRVWPQLSKELRPVLDHWDEVHTEGPLHATEITRRAVEDGYDQVIVVGGDGTFNEAVNGLFPEDEIFGIGTSPIRPNVRIVPVRRGTGGDFARMFNLRGSGQRVFSHLDSGHELAFDVGLCTFTDEKGHKRRRAFANIGSFGLSGLVVNQVNASKKKGGAFSFLIPTINALMKYHPQKVEVIIDDKLFYEGPMVLGVVANGRFFGGGVKIAPDAQPNDGLLDVVLLLSSGPREIIRITDVLRGRHVKWSTARVAQGRSVTVNIVEEASSPCLIELDGEQPGILSAQFEVHSGAVQLVVP